VRKRNAAIIACLAAALALVFFLAPIVALPMVNGCLGGSGHGCTVAGTFRVTRVVSPSGVLLGFGEVRYEAQYGENCPSAGICLPYDKTGFLFAWNCSDFAQYLH